MDIALKPHHQPLHDYLIAQFAQTGHKSNKLSGHSLYFDNKIDSYSITIEQNKYDLTYEYAGSPFAPIQIPRGLFLLTPGACYVSEENYDRPSQCCSCQASLTSGQNYFCYACKLSRDVLRGRIIPNAALWILSGCPRLVLTTLCDLVVCTPLIQYSYAPEINPAHYTLHEYLLRWFADNNYVSSDAEGISDGTCCMLYEGDHESISIDAVPEYYCVYSDRSSRIDTQLTIPRGLFLLTADLYFTTDYSVDAGDHHICGSCGTENMESVYGECALCVTARNTLREVYIPAATTWSLVMREPNSHEHDILLPEIRRLILATLCTVIVSLPPID